MPSEYESRKCWSKRLSDYRLSYWVLADDFDANCWLQAKRLYVLGILRDLDAFEYPCYSCIRHHHMAVGAKQEDLHSKRIGERSRKRRCRELDYGARVTLRQSPIQRAGLCLIRGCKSSVLALGCHSTLGADMM